MPPLEHLNTLASCEKLTIILLTFNRLAFLKKTIDSCFKQSNSNFNLLIVNNASTDGTDTYLNNLTPPSSIKIEVITNKINIGAKGSFLLALSRIEPTSWVTILCDDDLLDEKFVEHFYGMRRECPDSSCYVISVAEIDSHDNFKSRFINPQGYFKPLEAFKLISNGTIRPAGVSGFFFPANLDQISTYLKSVDNPHGYLEDTMMFMIASIQKGIFASKQVGYLRRIWPNQASSFSDQRIFDYYVALLLFDKKLRELLTECGFFNIRLLHKTMSHYQFFRIIQFPIITSGYLNLSICINYLYAARYHNIRYLPHAISMFFILPLTIKSTLSLRKRINLFRKKCMRNTL